MIIADLFDPASVMVNWTGGFQWGFMKPIIGKRTFGWIACGTINAKNRMGGYVGTQGFIVFIDPAGTLTAAMQSEWWSTCDEGPMVPLQPELHALAPGAPVGGPIVGVAEELAKLADLRDKGIVTAEEFQAQKAKLLAR